MTDAAFLRSLREAMAGRQPGEMADPRAPEEALRPASVLIPLYEEAGETGIVFVQRSDHLGKHAGQIAFPGGGLDPCDVDDLACALRESQEEVALPPEEVEVIGQLDRYATITGYRISPFVGRLRHWPLELVPDPGEVAAILTVPVVRLIEPGALRVASLGTGKAINFFDVGDHVIWGATARMLRQLLELALGRPLEPSGEVPWDKVRW